MCFKRHGDYLESETHYLKCLDIREANLPKDHPEVIAIKHNLSEVYHALGNQEKAAEFAAEVMQGIGKE